MNRFKLGCQTITFGEEQKNIFPEIFHTVSEAGYDGVEIGFRHIESIAPADLGDMLDQYGLELLAAHLGGNLEDPSQSEEEKSLIDSTLDYVQKAGGSIIMYSGLRYENPKQFDRDLKMLNRSAEKCRQNDIFLLYHNHDWEFRGEHRVIDSLVSDTSSSLGFCPDIGWIMKGGQDVSSFLNSAGDRVKSMHFKDFATRDRVIDTVVLGTGIAPLKEAAEWAHDCMEGGWIVAEQDATDISAQETVRENAVFLKNYF